MKKNPATDLLDALRASVVPTDVPPGFYTTAQLSAQTGLTDNMVRKKLAALNAECRMFKIQVGRFNRPVPHYRLV